MNVPRRVAPAIGFPWAAALVVTALLVAAPRAQATTIYELTSDHCTDGCGTPPFGTVTLEQNGTTVDITVSVSPNSFVKTGSADFMAFKFNATGVDLADITVDQTVALHTLEVFDAAPGSFDGNGTGEFQFGIECTSCGNGAADAFTDDIVFHVADATIADLIVVNNLGNIFVADILSAETGNTGPVDATPDSVVIAEPGAAGLIMMALSAFGLVGVARRIGR